MPVLKDQTCNMEVHVFFFRREDNRQGFGFTILAVSMAQKLGLQSIPKMQILPQNRTYINLVPFRPGVVRVSMCNVLITSGEKTAFKNFLLKYHGDT